MLQLKILFSFLILSSLIIFVNIGIGERNGIVSVFSQNDKDSEISKTNNNDDKKGLTTIKVKMNKNNLDIENHDRLKIVGYLNGEGQIKYIDLKELNKEEKQEKSPTLTTTNS